jgi:hypothetical protein
MARARTLVNVAERWRMRLELRLGARRRAARNRRAAPPRPARARPGGRGGPTAARPLVTAAPGPSARQCVIVSDMAEQLPTPGRGARHARPSSPGARVVSVLLGVSWFAATIAAAAIGYNVTGVSGTARPGSPGWQQPDSRRHHLRRFRPPSVNVGPTWPLTYGETEVQACIQPSSRVNVGLRKTVPTVGPTLLPGNARPGAAQSPCELTSPQR